MTLRRKIILYLAATHLIFAVAAGYFLWSNRVWLLAVEAVFAVSIFAGVKIFQSIFGPLDLIKTGVQFLGESDFNSRFRETGQPELDDLTRVYNRMADHLREERIRSREQHFFLNDVIRASPSGIVTFDFDDRIATVNPAAERILALPSDRLLARTLAQVETPFTQSLAGLEAGKAEILAVQGNRRVKCHKSHFIDRGFPRNFLIMEELTEELRRSERAAYGRIIRTMSHEINNSIGASNSLLESCLNYKPQLRIEDRQDFETALTVAISRTHHLNAFLKSYADVIRLPKPDPRPCDLRQLLAEISVLLRAELEKRRIEWHWDDQEILAPVSMDQRQMEQVFINILTNSMDAIGEDGSITIRLGRQFVVVEDSGCGIPPDVRPDLFTPFFSTKENGRGIGLTLVQEILGNHHFTFSLDSQPGEPTRFTIQF